MKIYSVEFGESYEGSNAVAFFTTQEEADRLITLLERNKVRHNDEYMYCDYFATLPYDLCTTVEEYIALPDSYDPYEVFEDDYPLESDEDEHRISSE